jgi:hypothetical protein
MNFVTIMPTRPAQRQTPAAERLVEMLAIRRQLSAEKVAAENASRLLEDGRIVRLAAGIDLLDKRMVEIVATDDALAPRYRLLTSKRVGVLTNPDNSFGTAPDRGPCACCGGCARSPPSADTAE